MRIFRFLSIFLLILVTSFMSSCVEDKGREGLEKLPYFDLKGFIEIQTEQLDSMHVIKTTRIKGQEQRTEAWYSQEEWKEELDVFLNADINTAALAQSYDTQVKLNKLRHELYPDEIGKVKSIEVTYAEDRVTGIYVKMVEENIFYTSTTLANLYMNNATKKVDHYSIETTQKIWFLEPNNMKVQGVVKK